VAAALGRLLLALALGRGRLVGRGDRLEFAVALGGARRRRPLPRGRPRRREDAIRGGGGRKADSVAGFTYSAAVKRSGVVWDEASLEKWLADRRPSSPASAWASASAARRSAPDVIAYLKTPK
jgi:hypothetical protein